MMRLCWQTTRSSVRAARAADGPWLRAALEMDVLHLQGRGSGAPSPPCLPDEATRCAFVLESRGALAGFALLRRGRRSGDSPLQPWDRREETSLLEPDAEGDALEVEVLAWRRGEDAERRRRVLVRDACQRICQRIGARHLLHAATPARTSDWRDRMEPEAFLQQLHHGALEDEALTPLMEMGCRLDGYRPRSETPGELEVVTTWRS